jgi:exopolysaccharide biosynthesis polyprenyl glycosylphosphotransferase
MSERRSHLPTAMLLDLRFSGTPIEEISQLYELTYGRVCLSEIKPSQLIYSEGLLPTHGGSHLRTFFSRVMALTGVILALPIMLLVAVAVKLTSRGPVFFRQRRVGLHERDFMLFKFRSMYEDAEAKTGPVWATANDPRITPLGVWLRKLRLDELPQLINVLRGEMALVGPRPARPEFVQPLSAKIPFYRQRHAILPGITGWAQINYKYGDTIEDTVSKLEYDLYYIKQASIWFDWYIMFHTIKTMLLLRGAQ